MRDVIHYIVDLSFITRLAQSSINDKLVYSTHTRHNHNQSSLQDKEQHFDSSNSRSVWTKKHNPIGVLQVYRRVPYHIGTSWAFLNILMITSATKSHDL